MASLASRCLSRVLLISCLFWALAPASARELTRDESKWAKVCIKNLSANSAKVRTGAEHALVLMGPDVLGTLFASLGEVKGSASERGLGRVLAGIGRKSVARWIANKRASSGSSAARKLDRLEALVGGALAPGEALTIEVRPSATFDWSRVPQGPELLIEGSLPRALAGAQYATAVIDGDLWVDTVGDEVHDTTIRKASPQVLALRLGGAPRRVLVYEKLGRWYACSAAVRSGTFGKLALELWDADLDGAFDTPRDYLRVGSGGWIRQAGERRVSLPSGPATYSVSAGRDGALVVTLTPIARPSWLDEQRWQALRTLNEFRSRVGRPALIADAERTKGCNLHARYLCTNAAADATTTKGGGAHREDAAKPGYSVAGDTAGRSSNIGGGDLNRMIKRITRTMLHRIGWLAASSEGVGLGHARVGRQEWNVVWCGGGDAVEHGGAIVVPAPGEQKVERHGAAEWPPPDTPAAFYDQRRGFPISVTPASGGCTNFSLELLMSDGRSAAPGRVWSTEKPIAAAHGDNAGSVFFMPSTALDGGSTYWVRFRATCRGKPLEFAWTFKTR